MFHFILLLTFFLSITLMVLAFKDLLSPFVLRAQTFISADYHFLGNRRVFSFISSIILFAIQKMKPIKPISSAEPNRYIVVGASRPLMHSLISSRSRISFTVLYDWQNYQRDTTKDFSINPSSTFQRRKSNILKCKASGVQYKIESWKKWFRKNVDYKNTRAKYKSVNNKKSWWKLQKVKFWAHQLSVISRQVWSDFYGYASISLAGLSFFHDH